MNLDGQIHRAGCQSHGVENRQNGIQRQLTNIKGTSIQPFTGHDLGRTVNWKVPDV